MLAVFSLLIVVTLSILITRIATVALSHTGLSKEAARFQARSAFTGVGYTTNESETIVNHPVRRRIALILMLLGNAGIVTAVSSLVLGFVKEEDQFALWFRLLLLGAGVIGLLLLASSKWIDHQLSAVIDWALRKYTKLELKDYASILHLASGYRISELRVRDSEWLVGKTLSKARLREEGVNVLGIQTRNGRYIGALQGDTEINAGDILILYGRSEALSELESRRTGIHGDIQHNEAVAEQKAAVEKEKKLAGQKITSQRGSGDIYSRKKAEER